MQDGVFVLHWWEGGQLIVCANLHKIKWRVYPPPFLFLFLLEYGRWLYFNKNIGGLYAYNLVSCVDSLIRVGVAKLAPVSKRASRSTRFAWNVTVAPGLLR